MYCTWQICFSIQIHVSDSLLFSFLFLKQSAYTQCMKIIFPSFLQFCHLTTVFNTLITVTYPYLKYLVGTNGMGLTMASLNFFLTSTLTSVPFLWDPLATYPMAMFLPSVGEGIPEVITPIIVLERERKQSQWDLGM